MKKVLIVITVFVFSIYFITIIYNKYFANSVISGYFSYPSEGIPSDLVVYIEGLNGKVVYRTDFSDYVEIDKNANHGEPYIVEREKKIKYSIKVRPGFYRIYAMTTLNPGYKAYYTEYVREQDNYRNSEKSHAPIVLKVSNRNTYNNINALDWYVK